MGMWMFLVITGCRKKKRNVRFLVLCAWVAVCGCLLVISVCLLVVCSRLLGIGGGFLPFAGGLWSFVGGLWSFVVVACFSNYGENVRFKSKPHAPFLLATQT